MRKILYPKQTCSLHQLHTAYGGPHNGSRRAGEERMLSVSGNEAGSLHFEIS
jgi:hypothetical protein